eukprot:6173721-Pleurochrysis_carterae.AAC.2
MPLAAKVLFGRCASVSDGRPASDRLGQTGRRRRRTSAHCGPAPVRSKFHIVQKAFENAGVGVPVLVPT